MQNNQKVSSSLSGPTKSKTILIDISGKVSLLISPKMKTNISSTSSSTSTSTYPVYSQTGWGLGGQLYADLTLVNYKEAVSIATQGVSSGVPSYPLYKHLAASLYQLIHFGTLCTTRKEIIPMPEDRSLKNKDGEWNKLVMEKGSSLLSMLKQVDFELHVQEPFFSQLNDGLKTVEGRCAVGDYNRIQCGDLLLFNKCLTLEVKDTRKYASFHEMLEAESLAEVLPGVSNIEEGVQIYRRFYSEEKERSNGVLAICVKTPPSQPHVIMASLLSVRAVDS